MANENTLRDDNRRLSLIVADSTKTETRLLTLNADGGLNVSISGSASGSTLDVVGNVAHDAVDSGNPVKIGGKAVDPVSLPAAVALLDRVDASYTTQGVSLVTLADYISGEDSAYNRMITAAHSTTSGILTGDTLIRTGAARLDAIIISQGDAAPTAGTITVYDNTAGSGTKKFEHAVTADTPYLFSIDCKGQDMGTGIYLDMTTTADLNIIILYSIPV